MVLDPWVLPVTDGREKNRGADSAISLGDDGRVDGQDDRRGETDHSDVWEKGHVEVVHEESATRNRSPEAEPTTEADERPDGSKQTSKVQELVEMYDDMARLSGTEASSTETVAVEDKEVDSTRGPLHIETKVHAFDPVEEVVVGQDESKADAEGRLQTTEEGPGKAPIPPDADTDSVHQVALVQETGAVSQEVQHEEPHDDWTEPQTEAPINVKPQTSSPSIRYPIDFTNLDTLFPNTEATSTIPEQLPESVIQDSFASVSQRKAWYRISRFGSIRKHNDGDDENYVRVSWNSSTVRKDTLATVRRWMEEDSIGGRVVLGRRLGHGGSSIFNWDSEAPAVEIGELLARKKQKPKAHARQASVNVEGTVTSPTLAAFGWSSSVPSSPVAGRFSSEWHSKPSRLSETGKALDVDAAPRVEAKPTPAPAPAPASMPMPMPAPDQVGPDAGLVPSTQDEDDDWGEMVSSSTVKESAPDDAVSVDTTVQEPVRTPTVKHVSFGTNEADPWGGLDMLGGDGSKATLESKSSTQTDAPIKDLPELQSVQEGTKAESCHTTVHAPRPARVELGSHGTQDDDVVARILAGLPDLSYLLK
jgi:hypothetical protein